MTVRLDERSGPDGRGYADFDAIEPGHEVKLFLSDRPGDGYSAVWAEVLATHERSLRVEFSPETARAWRMPRTRTVSRKQVFDHAAAGAGDRFWRGVGLAGAVALGLWWVTHR